MNSSPQNATFDADVIVIGAGIQGAGVAQALAAKGLKIIVVEAAASAATETSCKSSKLIHGGLRYLETGQLPLVYECLRERKILSTIAPHLVTLKSFYIPVYKGQKRSSLMIFIGLALYQLLGGGKFKKHSVKKAVELGIKTENLLAVYEYQDAQTDDAALTRAVLASAQHLGAQSLFNFQVEQIQNIEQGYRVAAKDGRCLIAPTIVNAAGPWVNAVIEQSNDLPSLAIELVQGAHLVLDLPAPNGCIYTESPDDGRAVFLLPWKGKLMVGTTELSRGNNPAVNEVTEHERDYLLRVVAHTLKTPAFDTHIIVESFSGVRVLPSEEKLNKTSTEFASNPNVKARETRFVQKMCDERQYLAIYGGKLTAYRATAQKVAALLLPYLHSKANKPSASTDTLAL